MNKKSSIIIFGIVCIVLGLTTDSSNFIPAIYKYLVGGIFVFYGIFFAGKDGDTN